MSEPRGPAQSRSRPTAAFAPAISLRHVNKWFAAHYVLHDVSLDINEGEVVVVCGPSGSGKSTLIRCINRLESIQSGEILVLGESITQPRPDFQI